MNSEIGEKFLPIGTVVMLKGGTKRAMITGFCSVAQEEEAKMYDYCGCIYPEGYVSSGQVCLFDHDQIEKVYYMGLVDDEEISFKGKLKTLLEQVDVDALLAGQAVTPADLPNVSLMPAPSPTEELEEVEGETTEVSDDIEPSIEEPTPEVVEAPVEEPVPSEVEVEPIPTTSEEIAPAVEETIPEVVETPAEEVNPNTIGEAIIPPESVDIAPMVEEVVPEVIEAPVEEATPNDATYSSIPETSEVNNISYAVPSVNQMTQPAELLEVNPNVVNSYGEVSPVPSEIPVTEAYQPNAVTPVDVAQSPIPSQPTYEPYYDEEPTYQPVYDGLEDNDYDIPAPSPITPDMTYDTEVPPVPTVPMDQTMPYATNTYQQPQVDYIPEIQPGSIPVGVEPVVPEPPVAIEEPPMPELMPVPEVEPLPTPAIPNMAADPLAGMVAPNPLDPNNNNM